MTTLEVKYTVDMWSEFQEFDWWLLNRGPLDSGFTVIGQSKLTLLQWTRKLLSLKTNQAYESTASVCHSFDSQQHRFRSFMDVCLAYFRSEISSLICFLWQAARLTAAARHFKQKTLQTRVFGYPSASQLDLDSFVLFTHSADMKVCHWLSCNFFLL